MNKNIIRVVADCKSCDEAQSAQIRERAGVLPLLAQRFDSRADAEAARQQIDEAVRVASPAGVDWTVTVVTGEHGQRDGATLR